MFDDTDQSEAIANLLADPEFLALPIKACIAALRRRLPGIGRDEIGWGFELAHCRRVAAEYQRVTDLEALTEWKPRGQAQ